jgi:hypothetical protein
VLEQLRQKLTEALAHPRRDAAPVRQADAPVSPADDSAYRPAKEFIDPERFPTFKAIRCALDANPTIRTRRPFGKNGKPLANRLDIHAGDWQQFKHNRQVVDPLDAPAEIVDAVMEEERRKAEIRQGK